MRHVQDSCAWAEAYQGFYYVPDYCGHVTLCCEMSYGKAHLTCHYCGMAGVRISQNEHPSCNAKIHLEAHAISSLLGNAKWSDEPFVAQLQGNAVVLWDATD